MKERIVLLGPPASGKGTQAEFITAKYGIPVTSPGAMLRDEKRRETALGIEADKLTSRGKLLPDEIIVELVQRWLEGRDARFVFDGFPRSLGQADALHGILELRGTPLDVSLALDADRATLERRVASRLVCQNCGLIVSAGLHVESATSACPNCGGAFGRRADDTPEVLDERLREYREKTAPVLSYYAKARLLHVVDSARRPEVVFASIAAILETE